VPSVVVPFAGDQFFWARRMAARGIAATCPAARLDGAGLVRAVAAAAQPGMQDAARCVAEAMRAEDGVRTAVDLLLDSGMVRR
jgi:UDP:flavonoid glycosyltransferase YjiC (YdhE family)